MNIYTYEYLGIDADPTTVAADIHALQANLLVGIYYEIENNKFVVEVVNDNFKTQIDAIVNSYAGTYVPPINGPLKELENVEIEHTYTAETETVIHSVPLTLGRPAWIYITLNGTSVIGANDEIHHRINLSTGEEITNAVVVTEGLASGVSNVWSRVWWVYVTQETTTLELLADFVPDISSVEPYEQDTTLTLLVHEAI